MEERTVMPSAAVPAPVTRIARRRAKPGLEAEYEARVRRMFGAMREQPGFLGADLLPPEQPGGDYQIVVRFASEADLQAWDASPARAQSHGRLREVAEGEPEFRRLSGLEAWFAPAVVPATMHPPRARMAVVTWLGIFPTVSLVLWLVAPLLAAWPFLLRTAVLTALIVATMTWVVMPRLTRWLRGWINPSAAR
ncbi:antibiotic biosynthesis monooxygenase [Azoarcus sp. DD4]|uniref:antibiotic biosynthesis monooxygenase n=1 Tax=Azoarcus sp. DD4 TaxID=2027405 RepID=UPI001F10A53C|nr:antibiotic biosynthesis monooxygenase [Azoarcus sp. DD4]